ncbi:hypothetical protein KY284_013849 [Solanum tuberosum]|nr:hypothetical protein KY284_013849 [Solanum tuberosum]
MKDKMDFCKVYRIPNQKYESTSVLAKPLMWDNTLKDDFLPLAGNKEVLNQRRGARAQKSDVCGEVYERQGSKEDVISSYAT